MKPERKGRVRCSAWLGCGVMAIVTPLTKQYQLNIIEAYADIVVSWDGKKLLMLKNRYGPNLVATTEALKCMAEAAPTAAWGSIRVHCSDLAKPHTPPMHLHGSGEPRGPRSGKTHRAQTRPVSPKGNRAAEQRRKHQQEMNTQSPSSQKVSRSYVRGQQPNDPSSATRPTGRGDCKPRRQAGFAAAHG